MTFDPNQPFTPQTVTGTPKTGLGYYAIVNVTATGFDQNVVGLLTQCYHQSGSTYCREADHVRTGLDGRLVSSEQAIRRV